MSCSLINNKNINTTNNFSTPVKKKIISPYKENKTPIIEKEKEKEKFNRIELSKSILNYNNYNIINNNVNINLNNNDKNNYTNNKNFENEIIISKEYQTEKKLKTKKDFTITSILNSYKNKKTLDFECKILKNLKY